MAATGYTNDVADGVEQASWVGALGSYYLPAGADEIVLEHYCVANPSDTGPNSVSPVSVCLTVSACPQICPSVTVTKN